MLPGGLSSNVHPELASRHFADGRAPPESAPRRFADGYAPPESALRRRFADAPPRVRTGWMSVAVVVAAALVAREVALVARGLDRSTTRRTASPIMASPVESDGDLTSFFD